MFLLSECCAICLNQVKQISGVMVNTYLEGVHLKKRYIMLVNGQYSGFRLFSSITQNFRATCTDKIMNTTEKNCSAA